MVKVSNVLLVDRISFPFALVKLFKPWASRDFNTEIYAICSGVGVTTVRPVVDQLYNGVYRLFCANYNMSVEPPQHAEHVRSRVGELRCTGGATSVIDPPPFSIRDFSTPLRTVPDRQLSRGIDFQCQGTMGLRRSGRHVLDRMFDSFGDMRQTSAEQEVPDAQGIVVRQEPLRDESMPGPDDRPPGASPARSTKVGTASVVSMNDFDTDCETDRLFTVEEEERTSDSEEDGKAEGDESAKDAPPATKPSEYGSDLENWDMPAGGIVGPLEVEPSKLRTIVVGVGGDDGDDERPLMDYVNYPSSPDQWKIEMKEDFLKPQLVIAIYFSTGSI